MACPGSTADVAATAAVLVLALLVAVLLGRRILFDPFDPAGFRAAGFRVWPVELAVTGVIAAGVVVSMPAGGASLGPALLIGPAAGGVAGLWASRALDIAAGGSVGGAMAGLFLLAYAGRWIAARARRLPAAPAGRAPTHHAAPTHQAASAGRALPIRIIPSGPADESPNPA